MLIGNWKDTAKRYIMSCKETMKANFIDSISYVIDHTEDIKLRKNDLL